MKFAKLQNGLAVVSALVILFAVTSALNNALSI